MSDKIKRVFSAFDGMSCAQIALNRLGIKYDSYFASEVDKYAKKVTQYNYPETIQVGDMRGVNGGDYKDIDLLIGGSPCQSLSRAGDGSGLNGKSGLFWQYVRLLQEMKPKYFILENVKPQKKEWGDIISKALGVEPIVINSNLVSAQNRLRYYWTNIPITLKLEDKGVTLDSVMCNNAGSEYFHTEKALAYLDRSPMNKRFIVYEGAAKAKCVTANFSKGVPYNVYVDSNVRKFTPEECEALQTVPKGYSVAVSKTQRYKMLGNGMTVDVIAYLISNIP